MEQPLFRLAPSDPRNSVSCVAVTLQSVVPPPGLDPIPWTLGNWVRHARADQTKGKTGLTTEERAELAGLRKENRELRMERDILKSRGLFRQAPSGSVRLDRPESAHAQTDRRLRVLVRASFAESRQRYGSPRIHEDLIEHEEHVSRKRLIRLMQEDGLVARARKRFKCTTMSDHDQPVAANLLDRRFDADAPNQRWVGDTTEFVIGASGTLYLAVILDLFSRFVVGWALSAVNDRHVTIKALEMALKRRGPASGLLHHSDQGCTYASEDYQALLENRGIVCSMSRRGNCYDNAVMESIHRQE